MTSAPKPIGPDEYRLGRALADIAADYAHMDAQAITSIQANSDRIVIHYAVRTGPEEFRPRVRVIDAKTSTSLTDNWEA